MAILRVKETWKRTRAPKPASSRDPVNALTADEQTNVMAALKVLRVRFGTWEAVADAMGVPVQSVFKVSRGHRKAGAGIAIRAARAAGVPVDDVLSGAFPKPGSCPMCGRSS